MDLDPLPEVLQQEDLPETELDWDPAGVPELHEVGIPDELRRRIERHRDRYPDIRSASIPSLWEVQRQYGWCTPEGIRQAAAVLGVTPGFLESVASFYDMLKLEPVGTHSVMVCTNISCWLRGADELMGTFCDAAGVGAHGGTSADGKVHVEHFECLGACDIAPMASIDHRYYGPLTNDDAKIAIGQLREGSEVLPGKRLIDRPMAGGSDISDDPRVATEGSTRGDAPGSPSAQNAGDVPPDAPNERSDESRGDRGPDSGGPYSEEGSGGAR